MPPTPPPQATPATEEELATLVSAAAGRGQAVSTEGWGSKRHQGSAGDEGALGISLRRLTRITAVDPGDMVVSAQAGARLVDLQRVLFEYGQWLPIDPPHAQATVGGILATASNGPRRLGYGAARDLLLGMRTMGPDGEITKSGARVVKNVSGFDLHRLQVGAFGALGIIVEAHFKVSARPALVAALLIGQPTLAQALATLLRVRDSALRPVALEALDAGAMAACRTLVPELPGGPGSPRTGAVAVVGIEGSRAALDRHLGDLAPFRAEARISTVLEGGACDRLWQALRDAPTRAADQVTARVAVKPHDLPALLAEIAATGPDLQAVTAQGGLGIARLRFSASLNAAAIAATVRRWAEAARARRGYAVVESAPLGLPERSLLPFRTGPVSPLERQIKQAFDPLHLLNPGRAPL